MIPVEIVSIVSLLYLGLLFVVARFAEKRREAGHSVISNGYVYSLSLAVHYTSWSYYGMVGQAATVGIAFFAPYLGATLMTFSWWFLLRKMVRVSKEQNILSIADFISSRYGKSVFLGSIVTVFSLLAIMPHLALQLKAVSYTFNTLSSHRATDLLDPLLHALPPFIDTGFIAALLLGVFAILFGARHLDASERHDGLVAALAMQSVVKLVAFVAVGIFVTYGLFDGFSDIFSRFAARFPERGHLFLIGTPQVPYSLWFSWLFFPMMAVMLLPHQFHVLVIENSDESHIKDAMWLFPAYTWALCLFVMPIALGGTLINGGDTAAADFFALRLPLESAPPWLAMLVFIGGFSAAAGIVMLEGLVLSTMILNHLVLPLILKFKVQGDLSRPLIYVKRGIIIGVVLLGHLYYRMIGEPSTLVNIGVVSLIAVCQFAPAIIGGLYWKGATKPGAVAGLISGFVLWFYTLVLPLLVRTTWFYDGLLPVLVRWGWLERDILQDGPFGLAFLRPQELFGLSGLDMLSHALFWTMFFNLGAFLAISLLTTPEAGEAEQAEKFVDVFETRETPVQLQRMSKAPNVLEFTALLTKFIGEKQAQGAIAPYLAERQVDGSGSIPEHELPALMRFTERVLAGSVGAAAAGVIVQSYFAERGSAMEDVFDIFGTVTLSRTRSREQLGVLYESAKIVASGADLQTIQDNILKLLQEQFKFETGIIRILDPEQRCLTVRGHRGMSFQHFDESVRELDHDTYAGESFLTNAALVINDTDVMDKPLSARVVRQEGIKSFAHAPIMIEGEAVGLLSAYSKSMKGIFTDEFMELFKSLAGQIGIALRNARQAERLIQAREHEKEMQIAKIIQLGLLPTGAPEVAGISLAGVCLPAHEVGGDYYDFLAHGVNALDLVIADVSGHNVGAALMMAETRAFIQAGVKSQQRPAEILSTLNELLYEDLTRAELFITMFYLYYRAETGTLAYGSAGHNPPMLWRASSQSCERLDAEGLILGVKRKVAYEEKQVQLEAGDMLLLYTDGITEAVNPAGEFFGEERLCALLEECRSLSPQELIDRALDRVRSFVGAPSFVDDISMVVMRVE